jgi:hypothetical protein
MLNIKNYLEKLLHEKYQHSLAPTLRALEDICKKTELELNQVKTELNQHDVEVSEHSHFPDLLHRCSKIRPLPLYSLL